MKSLSIHSHKGGVGKTTISVNLAVHLAKKGKRVCLLDNDFSGPALQTFFKPKFDNINYLNDFFDKEVSLNEILYPLSEEFEFSGEIFIGYADPTPDSINRMLRLNDKEATKMLQGMSTIRRQIQKNPFDVDYLIVDTTPGIGLTTVNSFIVTESILFIIKVSNSDIEGTVNMISGLMDTLHNRPTLVANQIPVEKISNPTEKNKMETLIVERLAEETGGTNVEFLGWIPTDWNLQRIEFENTMDSLLDYESQRTIFTLHQPDHVFSKAIEMISSKLFDER